MQCHVPQIKGDTVISVVSVKAHSHRARRRSSTDVNALGVNGGTVLQCVWSPLRHPTVSNYVTTPGKFFTRMYLCCQAVGLGAVRWGSDVTPHAVHL